MTRGIHMRGYGELTVREMTSYRPCPHCVDQHTQLYVVDVQEQHGTPFMPIFTGCLRCLAILAVNDLFDTRTTVEPSHLLEQLTTVRQALTEPSSVQRIEQVVSDLDVLIHRMKIAHESSSR